MRSSLRIILTLAALALPAPLAAQTRLHTDGFEQNTLLGWYGISASPSTSTSNPRSGTYSLLIDANQEFTSKTLATAVTSNWACARTSFYVATTPAATAVILAARNSTPTVTQSITMNTSRNLTLVNDVTAASQAGPTLNAATHYWVELCVLIDNTAGEVRWRVNGTEQTAITGVDTLSTNIASFTYGTQTNSVSPLALYYDDTAIHTHTSLAWFTIWNTGEGGIEMLEPNGDVSVQFTKVGGTGECADGGTSASCLDEIPGAFDDGTTRVESSTQNQVDRLSLTALSAGVPSDAVIKYASVCGRVGGNGTSGVRQMRFKLWDEGGSLTDGPTTNLNDVTTWSVASAGHCIEYNATGKTKANIASFDAGYEVFSAHYTQVSVLWMNVEWTNASASARRRIISQHQEDEIRRPPSSWRIASLGELRAFRRAPSTLPLFHSFTLFQIGSRAEPVTTAAPRNIPTYSRPSTSGLTKTQVTAGSGTLQTAYTSAACGTALLLDRVGTYTGTLTLNKDCSAGSPLIVCTENIAADDCDYSIPALVNVRVDALQMPDWAATITAANAQVVVTASNTFADYHYFVGVKVEQTGSLGSSIVAFGNGNTSLSTIPSQLWLDSVWVTGTATNTSRRALALNCTSCGAVNSWLIGHENGADSQAILTYYGSQLLVDNNTLIAAGENFLAGGAKAATLNDCFAATDACLRPSDISVTRNWLYKPDAWNPNHASFSGIAWDLKNIFELKTGERVELKGNVLEGSPADAQSGYADVLTPRVQSGESYAVVDVNIENNLIRNACSGITTGGIDTDDPRPSPRTRRVRIHNNAFQNIGQDVTVQCGGDGTFGRAVPWTRSVRFQRVTNNTFSSCRRAQYTDITASQTVRALVSGNIFACSQMGWAGSGTSEGNSTMTAYMPDSTLTSNAFVGSPSANYSNHPGNSFPVDVAAVRFVNAGTDDRLCTGVDAPVAGCPGASPELGKGADMTLIPTVPGSLTGHNPAEQSAHIHTVASLTPSTGPCDGTAASDVVVAGTKMKSDIEVTIGSAASAAAIVPIQARTETEMTIRMPVKSAAAYNVVFWRAGFAVVKTFTCT